MGNLNKKTVTFLCLIILLLGSMVIGYIDETLISMLNGVLNFIL